MPPPSIVNAPPTLTLVGPAPGTDIAPGDPLRLDALATDTEDGDLGAAITWTSSLDQSLGTGSPLVVATLRSGTHTVTARVTDRGGRSASASTQVVVNAPPTLTLAGPASGAVYLRGLPVPLAASAHDREDGDLNAAIAWTSDVDGPLGTGGTLALTTLRSGTHRLTATIADAGGKTASAQTTIVVDAAPVVTITGPADGATFIRGEPIALTATAVDGEDGPLSAALVWTSDLDGPLVRITTPHCPLPAADILEDAILPTVDRIVDRVKRTLQA